MHKRVNERPNSFGDYLWLQWPDHPEHSVVWLVFGKTVDDPHGVTIPLKYDDLKALGGAIVAFEAGQARRAAGEEVS